MYLIKKYYTLFKKICYTVILDLLVTFQLVLQYFVYILYSIFIVIKIGWFCFTNSLKNLYKNGYEILADSIVYLIVLLIFWIIFYVTHYL